MKRILTVQDISCVGKCSLTVALPIISAFGIEAAILPTATLSTHTAFKGFTFRDLTEDMLPITRHWKELGIEFDGIYTGYLGSVEQIDLVLDIFEKFGENSRIITDECIYTFNETSSERDIVDSVEEFDARIEHIQIKVEVGLRNYCIVIFEKNSANELEIVNWYWEK